MEYKKEDGKDTVTITGGKNEQTKGPFYTTKGKEHDLSGSYIHDDDKTGYEASYTNRKITGNGREITPFIKYSNTNTRERKFIAGTTTFKDGRRRINGGYEDTTTNKNSRTLWGKEASRSDYQTKSFEGEGNI